MAPPVPPRYSRGLLEGIGVSQRTSQLTTMILRHLIRYPVRTLMTTTGIAASCALLVMSLSSNDAVEKMIDITYFQSSRQHVTIGFENLKPRRAILDVARLPGVLKTEPVRIVAATLRNGHRSRRISIQALDRHGDLQRLLDLKLAPFTMPEAGLVLSEKLARILDVNVGDVIEVETTDHRRRVLRLPVSALQQGYLGLSVFADLDTMNALLGDGHAISSVHMSIDTTQEPALYAKLKSLPSISSIMMLRASLKTFRDTLAQNIHIMMSVYVILSVVITFGVVYNSARIQLSERARELASLRVLGFTTAEVSYILLGQIAITVVAAIPLGWIGGYWFTAILMQSFETELYRVPLTVERSTYGWAALIVLATALISALVVRRRVDALNLVSVLKSRE